MEEKDFIKELFQEKLAQHQSPVSPDLWASVSSSISSGTTVVSSGLSLLSKWIIGGLSAAAVIGGVLLVNRPKNIVAKMPAIHQSSTQKPAKSSNENTGSSFLYDGRPTKQLNKKDVLVRELNNDNLIETVGFGSASCGPGIPATNNHSEVMPLLPLQTTVSNQNNTLNIETPIVNEPLVHTNEPSPTVNEEAIVLPNIFTPNGDGKNDVFSIDLSEFEFVDYSLVILDMNNQIVFKSNNPNESWDGKKINGDYCTSGTYIYYLSGKTVSGKTISKYATLRVQY